MRRSARTDRNQAEIAAALRGAGCSVECLHAVGGGVPDLLVGRTIPLRPGRLARMNWLLEVKDGEKPPSARQLTDDQEVWHRSWRGQVAVVTTIEEALIAVGLL